MGKFKIGDKVRILDGSKIKRYTGGWNKEHMGSHVGEVHEITHIEEEWGDSPCAAYMLDIRGLCSHAKWDERGLELVSDQKVVITTNGRITTAVLYEGRQRIKEAKAICAPSDEFNFNYGASLALSRLNDDKTTFGERANKTYIDEFGIKSQMDRFIDGEIFLEIPEGKTMDFLKECERIGLKWAAGQKATEFGNHEKYFKVLFDHLTCCSTRIKNESWEIWDGTKATKKIEAKSDDVLFSAFKASAAMAALLKLMKDSLDD